MPTLLSRDHIAGTKRAFDSVFRDNIPEGGVLERTPFQSRISDRAVLLHGSYELEMDLLDCLRTNIDQDRKRHCYLSQLGNAEFAELSHWQVDLDSLDYRKLGDDWTALMPSAIYDRSGQWGCLTSYDGYLCIAGTPGVLDGVWAACIDRAGEIHAFVDFWLEYSARIRGPNGELAASGWAAQLIRHIAGEESVEAERLELGMIQLGQG